MEMKKKFIAYSEEIDTLLSKGFEIEADSLEEAERKVLEFIDIQEVENLE